MASLKARVMRCVVSYKNRVSVSGTNPVVAVVNTASLSVNPTEAVDTTRITFEFDSIRIKSNQEK